MSDHRLYCLPSVDISEGDRVSDAAKEYDVISVNNVMGFGHHLEVDMKIR